MENTHFFGSNTPPLAIPAGKSTWLTSLSIYSLYVAGSACLRVVESFEPFSNEGDTSVGFFLLTSCCLKLDHPDVRSFVAADVDLDGKVSVEEFDSMIEAAAALPRYIFFFKSQQKNLF